MENVKTINYKSCFDIIGPIMIGPSSSHTAGAIAIGLLARQLFGGTPEKIECVYYESFAETHKGHGTDYAIVSGVLGFATDDDRVPQGVEIAMAQGIQIDFIEDKGPSPVQHANTADLILKSTTRQVRLIGTSIGGGAVEVKYIEVDGFELSLSGPLPIVIEVRPFGTDSLLAPIMTEQHIQIACQHERETSTHQLLAYELQELLAPEVVVALQSLQNHTKIYIFA